ncbi:MAG: steroid 5-alpha reductase family enzyme [Acidimicrobiales bacterium]|jgi:steroid 5-alpha reductase family enzyme
MRSHGAAPPDDRKYVASMKRSTAISGIMASLFIGTFIGWAGSNGSVEVAKVPVFAVCALVAYLINWVAFVPSYRARTEAFYDLTGSATYLTLTTLALLLSDLDGRAFLVAGLVSVWALRLGTFLFRRVKRDGGDGRFDAIKCDPVQFFMSWSVQALWVLLTLACGLAAITGAERQPLGASAALGALVWISGFAIEATADRQKSAFKADPANDGRFISTGLWAWSRHPNYFGEITLWVGIAIIALPVLSGWRLATLISPVFVYILLTRVSGIPLLERRAQKRWGNDPAFQSYTDNTPALIPRPPRT